MQRTTIETAADNHILITLERDECKGGNSHRRRVQRKLEEARKRKGEESRIWFRLARIILRHGVPAEIPVKFAARKAAITLLPLGSDDNRHQAYENSIAAAEGVCAAERITDAIDARTAVLEAGEIAPPKRRRLVWVDEDDHVETSQPDPLEYV